VKRSMAGHPPPLLRPVRAAVWLFSGIAVLIAVSIPFVPVEHPELVLPLGLGYSLVLSVFGVGVGLAAHSRILLWWMAMGPLLFVAMFAFTLLLRPDPQTVMRVAPWALRAMSALLGAWLTLGVAVAGWGWTQYALWRHSAGPHIGPYESGQRHSK
jgi:hypothetical protein